MPSPSALLSWTKHLSRLKAYTETPQDRDVERLDLLASVASRDLASIYSLLM